MQDSSVTSGSTSEVFDRPLTWTELLAKIFLCWDGVIPSQASLSYDTTGTQLVEAVDEALDKVDTIFIQPNISSVSFFSDS